ncbi:Uncharacterised protein [Actinobacillus pleuropneumoniae]|nr:Uncharacterised protein [Actinobacillus pleuropneumoniae]
MSSEAVVRRTHEVPYEPIPSIKRLHYSAYTDGPTIKCHPFRDSYASRAVYPNKEPHPLARMKAHLTFRFHFKIRTGLAASAFPQECCRFKLSPARSIRTCRHHACRRHLLLVCQCWKIQRNYGLPCSSAGSLLPRPSASW